MVGKLSIKCKTFKLSLTEEADDLLITDRNVVICLSAISGGAGG